MHRTQIYLPDDQYQELRKISQRCGRSLADLVRTAVGAYLRQGSDANEEEVLTATSGLWRNQETELDDLRRGWSRRTERHE